MILFEIFSLIAIVGLILYMYKFHLKNDFLRHLDNITELLRENLNRQKKDIISQFGVSKTSDSIGLKSLNPDAATLEFDHLIIEAQKLIILMNDGRTWASVQRDRLRKRFSDPRKETTVFVIHPDSPMINVLARKGSIEPQILKQRIKETLQLFNDISGEDTRLEILGHHLFNPHSMIITEDTAIVIPYFVSRGGRTVPAFCYDHIDDDECYYKRLYDDLERLRMDSQSLFWEKTGTSLSNDYKKTDQQDDEKKVVNISNSLKKPIKS